VQGRVGSLHDYWREHGTAAYLSMCIPTVPNFFILYGPHSNLGHNSIIVMLEAQADYVAELLALANDHRSSDANL